MSELDSFFAPSQDATGAVIGLGDNNPDEAARALQISRINGLPPTLVASDLPTFERETSANLAASIVKDNPYIQDYINSNPMAARVSSDDWATLDTITKKVANFSAGLNSTLIRTANAYLTGAEEAWTEPTWATNTPEKQEFWRQNQERYGVVSTLSKASYTLLGAPLEILSKVLGPVPETAKTFVENAYGQITGDHFAGERLGREAAGFIEYMFNKPPIHSGPGPMAHIWANRELRALADSTGPFIRAGQEPPVGIHPAIDKLKTEQTKLDLKELDEATSDVMKSTTRERSPEMFADLLRQKLEGDEVRISFDAIVKLYGDKPIRPDDGILGWVPNIQEQVRTMSLTGGDIHIPKAEWLAKIDKEVAKSLRENVRIRPRGMTLEEIANLEEYVKAKEEIVAAAKETKEYTISDFIGAVSEEETMNVRVLRHADGTVALDNGFGIVDVAPAYRHLSIEEQIAHTFGSQPDGTTPDVSKVRPKSTTGRVMADVEAYHGSPHEIEVLDRNGEAVRAVRAQAGLDSNPIVMQEITKHISAGLQEITQAEEILFKKAKELLDQVAGEKPELMAAHEVQIDKGTVQGAYQAFKGKARPLIIFSLLGERPLGTVRHEAIHFLREYGFFTPTEWTTLIETAKTEGWLEKHNIRERYKSYDLTEAALLEEAIADEYAAWSKKPGNTTAALAKVFEKLSVLLAEIRDLVQKAWGKDITAEEIFARVERGEVKSRTGTKRLSVAEVNGTKASAPKQLELDVTRQGDKALYETASALGMTIPQYKKYMELIKKRNIEDVQAQRERAIALEKKRQSLEWRQESEQLDPEVRRDLQNRADISAVAFFRYGELDGVKLEGRRPKLNSELLTEEEKKLVPAQWLGKADDIHPDDAASMFGFSTRGELLDAMASYEAARGTLRPGEFFDRQVKAEIERRMVARHGQLDANILSEAEDHVLGATQMDMLHEETVAAGMKAGKEITFTKEDVQNWAATRFNEALASKVSAVKLLDEAGRAGRAAELALLKGDYLEAFKQKQRQQFSLLMAKEAKGFEKETTRFERLADRYASRQGPKSTEQVFTDQIQDLLRKANLPVRRTAAELFDAFERSGYKTLDDFVQKQIADGYELDVQPYLSGQIKDAKQMSVLEAREFRTAVKSLDHVGKEVRSIEVDGAKKDFEIWKKEVVDNIKQLPLQPKQQNAFLNLLYKIDSELVKMEEVVKDLDLREELGPLWNVLIRPFGEAKHTEYTMMEKLAQKFRDMQVGNKEWRKTLDDNVPQNFFFDPDGTLFEITRQDLLNIMLNMGNKSNIEKFVMGWRHKEDPHLFEQKLWKMIEQNAKAEDWKFVQSIWDMFGTWRKEADEMYYQLSGVPPKWIEPQAITTPHGNFAGGYFPIFYDKYWGKTNLHDVNSVNPNSVFYNTHRSTPANHYTKTRTGYVDYVEFQEGIDRIPERMQQEIHDIAYRRQIIEAKKVISDPQIRAAIRQHYGAQYEAQLTPWLQKIASQYNSSPELQGFNGILRKVRGNLVIHALGFNARVFLSPDVGNFAGFGDMMANHKANESLVMSKSKEVTHTFRDMDRDFREQLEQSINAKGWDKFQADAMRWSMTPAVWFSQQFRMATWAKIYKEKMAAGLAEGDAIALADSTVRERHGSAGIADLPDLMTQNEGYKMMTMFYGYFNTMYNWQRQIPGAVRRGDMAALGRALWGTVLIPAAFGGLLFNQQREGDSWGKTIAKALLLAPLSTVPIARDIASTFAEGYSNRSPIASVIQAAYSIYTDTRRMVEGKKVEKPISHVANIVGLTAGLPLAQIGRTSQFLHDVNTGKQRPRNILEWTRGIISGEARLKK